MVERVVYGARHSIGGIDHLRSAGDDPGNTRGAHAGGTGRGGGGVLSGADRRVGDAELAGESLAAVRGVCADCGFSVGDPAYVVGRGTASEFLARVYGGGGFLR